VDAETGWKMADVKPDFLNRCALEYKGYGKEAREITIGGG